MKRLMNKTWPTWMLYAFVIGFQGVEDPYPFTTCPLLSRGGTDRWFDSAHRAYDFGWRLGEQLERMKI